MYRRVLVALDESEWSESVLPEVEWMSSGSQVALTIVLMTVAAVPAPTLQTGPEAREVPAMLGGGPPTAVEPRLVESTGQALARVEDELKTNLEEKAQPLRNIGLTVETVVRFGDPAQEIVDYAKTHGIDLIVMATHGRTGLSRALFGSVAGRVLASGAKPVLMLQPQADVDQQT